MGAADNINLTHVMYQGRCEDPDCEIHNPEVGLEEEVIDLTDVAFYYAGAQELRDMFLFGNVDCPDDADDEERLDACLKVLRLRFANATGVKGNG